MNAGPLERIRVADFSWAWAGPHGTMMLADMGAEVINFEMPSPTPSHTRRQPPFVGGVEQGLNSSGWFSSFHRNKRSCVVNLKHPRGLEVAARAVAVSDVFVQNFGPGVMERLGLGYEAVRAVRPDIIYLSLSSCGQTGPKGYYSAFGPQLALLSGFVRLTGYTDSPPSQTMVAYADPVSGLFAAYAIMAALQHRLSTGKGQLIDVSQYEAMVAFLPQALLDYQMNGRLRQRQGNADETMAPHGCYRCRGEEEWVAIAVGSEGEWRGLCRGLGEEERARDARYASPALRRRHDSELDAWIEGWTRERSAHECMEVLQRHGVAATPSLSGADLIRDQHLMERGFLVKDEAAGMGGKLMAGPPWRMSGTPCSVRWPAPAFGQDNRLVLEDVLGYTPAEVTELRAEGVIRDELMPP